MCFDAEDLHDGRQNSIIVYNRDIAGKTYYLLATRNEKDFYLLGKKYYTSLTGKNNYAVFVCIGVVRYGCVSHVLLITLQTGKYKIDIVSLRKTV